ncbi:MAG: hypothetical protein LBV60_25770 [Streptomyces sp.]|jgi:hypothetical protein|nr:hypothetical protein [Streptomyces sp.]
MRINSRPVYYVRSTEGFGTAYSTVEEAHAAAIAMTATGGFADVIQAARIEDLDWTAE